MEYFRGGGGCVKGVCLFLFKRGLRKVASDLELGVGLTNLGKNLRTELMNKKSSGDKSELGECLCSILILLESEGY